MHSLHDVTNLFHVNIWFLFCANDGFTVYDCINIYYFSLNKKNIYKVAVGDFVFSKRVQV